MTSDETTPPMKRPACPLDRMGDVEADPNYPLAPVAVALMHAEPASEPPPAPQRDGDAMPAGEVEELRRLAAAIALGPDDDDRLCRACGDGPLSHATELEPAPLCNPCAQWAAELLPTILAERDALAKRAEAAEYQVELLKSGASSAMEAVREVAAQRNDAERALAAERRSRGASC